ASYLLFSSFFFSGYGHHRDLLSFPTRRSSDLRHAGARLAALHPRRDADGDLLALALVVSDPGQRDVAAQFHCRVPLHHDVRFGRSEEHTSELQSRGHLVCRLLLEKKKKQPTAQ